MPRPSERGQRYMPGLDGLRALAVLAVLAYHLDIGWAEGGLLGVGVFFTLSGYLITDLLLEEWTRGGIRLGRFWLRRARRLLPALFVVLIAVAAWVTLFEPAKLEPLRGAVASAAGYVNNWWMIFQEVPYADRFGAPAPLGHLWSLAIEEQFYLVWPFVLLLGLRFLREPAGGRVRLRLAAATLVLAALSAALMALLYQPGFDSIRVYEGTDTRAFGLLIGAALAMVWPARRLVGAISTPARRTLDGAGLACLVVIALLIWRTDYFTPFLYPYGLVLLSVATALLIPALAHPRTRLGRAFGWQPVRWIGVRSYGIYLWHFPVIALSTPSPDPGFDLGRAAVQTAVTFALAAVSWRWVEDPIRQGALGRLWRRARSRASGARRPALPRIGWAGVATGVAATALAIYGLSGASSVGPANGLSASLRPSAAVAASAPPPGERPQRPAGQGEGRARLDHVPPRTSCDAVVHIGDSTSEGLVSSSYLPDRRRRIDSQYARVGATRSRMEIEGATSIVELPPDDTNAFDAASAIAGGGYDGCWVIALGTNDGANAAIGSQVGVDERIERMMSVIGGRPALWLTARTLLGSGAYADEHMRAWNAALLRACERYPNLRVFDWAAAARDEWFIEDGIHYTSDGYAARAHRIAIALAEAFPAAGRSAACLVG